MLYLFIIYYKKHVFNYEIVNALIHLKIFHFKIRKVKSLYITIY